MSVTLIVPKDFSDLDPYAYANLGVLYLASYLEKHDVEVKIHDLRYQSVESIEHANFYGITSTSNEIEYCKRVSLWLTKHFDCKTIIGGAHASNLPEDCVSAFNYVVIGEGERGLLNIVRGCEEEGLVYSQPIVNLDDAPFPARHLVPPSHIYSEAIFGGHGSDIKQKSTSIISSRGCPHNCAFCGNIPKQTRFRSAENVVAEIDQLDCTHFRFIDDNFALSRSRLEEFVPLFQSRGVTYRCSNRSAMMDDGLCELLVDSGCKEVGIGVEVADDDNLSLLKKGETVDTHKWAIENIRNAGMRVKTFFMAGLPNETWETIDKNMDFLRETKPDKVFLTMFCPYPGCDIWNNPEDYGVTVLTDEFSRYWNFPPSVIEIDVASNEELNRHYEMFSSYIKSGRWK